MYVILNDELAHHGIKGQRWGVRRFQNTDGSLKPAGAKRYSKSSNTNGVSKKQKVLNQNFGEISTEEIASALSILTAITAPLAIAKLQSNAAHKKVIKEQNQNKENNPFSAIKKTTPAKNKADDMKKINPDFGKVQGSTMNCTLCTTAYEMRRRGYDVTANFSSMGRGINEVSTFYKNTTRKDWVVSKPNEKGIMQAFDRMPDGSRGNICASVGTFASKHSMVWEKENGKVTIRDCQSNKVYDSDNLFMRNGSSGIVRTNYPVNLLRTDNREINPDAIMDAVRPVGK